MRSNYTLFHLFFQAVGVALSNESLSVIKLCNLVNKQLLHMRDRTRSKDCQIHDFVSDIGQ